MHVSVNEQNKEPDLASDLKQLFDSMKQEELRFSFLLEKLHPSQRLSAINLLHYLFLRSRDIGSLQTGLHLQGFSTFTGSEGYIRSQLLAVLQHFGFNSDDEVPYDFFTAQKISEERAFRLFGKTNDVGVPSIMVTFKTSFAQDYLAVKKLMKAGMNVARINCAHDDEATWLKMIKVIKDASEFSGIPCKIYMDLAGPKLRTKIKVKKNRIEVEEEDIILLTGKDDIKSRLPVVECSIPNVAEQLQLGERVVFDDGLIETKVIGFKKEGVELEVTRVSSKKPFLKTEKGINFPDSHFSLSALTGYDLECLPFILENADMIGYSFLESTTDLQALQNAMTEKKLPLILKIERPEAVQNLPALLLQAMQQQYYGVMIARGDLAVEIGFERLSEIQEEILWICEAAHAPVIWATQILENLNKTGLPSRSEVTDAAHGIMAECILLNKGAHTLKVIKSLKDILSRSGRHHSKKQYTFMPLGIAKNFLARVPS